MRAYNGSSAQSYWRGTCHISTPAFFVAFPCIHDPWLRIPNCVQAKMAQPYIFHHRRTRMNEYKPPKKLPHLDVLSPYLVYVYSAQQLNGRHLKRAVEKSGIGRVAFIETFEAWKDAKLGSQLFQFQDATTMHRFLNMPRRWLVANFGGIPYANALAEQAGAEEREKFFADVLSRTGVDLLECRGVPPGEWTHSVLNKMRDWGPGNPKDLPLAGSLPRPVAIVSPSKSNSRRLSSKHSLPLPETPSRDTSQLNELFQRNRFAIISDFPPDCSVQELQEMLGHIHAMPSAISIIESPAEGELPLAIASYSSIGETDTAILLGDGMTMRGGSYKIACRRATKSDEPMLRKMTEAPKKENDSDKADSLSNVFSTVHISD